MHEEFAVEAAVSAAATAVWRRNVGTLRLLTRACCSVRCLSAE